MMTRRRTQAELALEAEARVRKEQAKLKLERIKLRRDGVRARRRLMLSVSRAAEQDRFTKDWIAPETSADSETISDIPRVNARARQLLRDDPYAISIQRCFQRNVVGTGITPAIDDKPYSAAWAEWSRTPAVMDMERRRNFIDIQGWAIDECVAVGEAFVVRWIMQQPDGSHRLVLQLFESEQLDRYKIEHEGNEVRGGIEVDEYGAPVAYHFYRRHPHDIRGLNRPAPLMLETMRIPASMVCHIYDPQRARQTRGISWLRPVLRKLRDLAEYDATQLRVARAEASIGLIITGSAIDENGNPEDPLELDGLNVAHLAEGESVTPFAPTRPGREYEPFLKAQLRAIAAGVGLSYEQLARDLTQTTYSGGRQGSIDDHREFEPLIGMLISQLCEPVFRDFVFVWAMQNPEASQDFFLRDQADLATARWQGQGWDWVDPEAQGKAIERKMLLGLTTRTIEATRLGLTTKLIDKQAAEDGTLDVIDRLRRDKREAPQPAESPDATSPRRTQQEVSVGA